MLGHIVNMWRKICAIQIHVKTEENASHLARPSSVYALMGTRDPIAIEEKSKVSHFDHTNLASIIMKIYSLIIWSDFKIFVSLIHAKTVEIVIPTITSKYAYARVTTLVNFVRKKKILAIQIHVSMVENVSHLARLSSVYALQSTRTLIATQEKSKVWSWVFYECSRLLASL